MNFERQRMEHNKEIRRHMFKYGRRLSDMTPGEQANFMKPRQSATIEQNSRYLHDKIDHLQGELNFLMNKLNQHIDIPKTVSQKRKTKAEVYRGLSL